MENTSVVHTLYGQFGHFLILLSFVSVFVAFISYILGTVYADTNQENSWKKLGRLAFTVHAVSIVGAIVTLIAMIQGHFFEYKYVWQHSSKSLPFKYLLAAFWEGQEGSTLLWMFWTAILGMVLIFRERKWEAPVLTIMALVQVLLGLMELGIYIFGYKIGSTPFSLMKDVMQIPIYQMNPNYVAEDGSGLNPSLQNYWMVIHPPTLFLGFAATAVPFAYAFASLVKRDYHTWIKPALPWALFATAVLGTGVLMGGAWAYEALNFGGFWAWDPVENASLVPWIILVAGVHTLLAYRHTGYSLPATYLLFFLSFILVQYSSFLTKSGVLGDSSVHSFTDLGMSGLLMVSMLAFILPSVVLFILRYKEMPNPKKEEALSSREFWLFLGSLIFVFSALHIIGVTSIPALNKFTGLNLAQPSNIKAHYNNIQIWIAILIGLGTAVSQFFIYKQTDIKKIRTAIAICFILAVFITVVFAVMYKITRPDYVLMLLFGNFAVFGNLYYFLTVQKRKIRASGASIAHIGFGFMIVGILVSQAKQEVVSLNKFGLNYGSGFSNEENENNILLYLNEPQEMNGYRVTYIGDSIGSPNIFFKVKYEKLDKKSHPSGKSFVLIPNIIMNPKKGNVANPDTKHQLHKDLYTHITSAPLKEDGTLPDSLIVESYNLSIGDTMKPNRCYAILDSIDPFASADGFETKPGDIIVGAKMRVITMDGIQHVEPKYFIRGNVASSIPARIEGLDTRLSFTRIDPEQQKFEITVEQKMPKYIIMKAIIFPWINFLWLGAFIMVMGTILSMLKRIQDRNRALPQQHALND